MRAAHAAMVQYNISVCLSGFLGFFKIIVLVLSSSVGFQHCNAFISDNTNVESRSLSVVKYIINNITGTALTGRRKTVMYLNLVRELLYNIDWPSRRLLTYWHFVHV